MNQYNVLICGVGGQGVMSLGTLLKQAAMPEGMVVVGSEVRGAAQREGAVTSTVRYTVTDEAEKYDERRALHSGKIPFGRTDLMIATEPSEALRNAHFLSSRSKVILNTYVIKSKGFDYPEMENIVARIREITNNIYTLNANEISLERYGSYRMANAILLGAALAHSDLPVSRDTIELLLERKEEVEALDLGINLNVGS